MELVKTDTDGVTTAKNEEDFASGDVCYLLNSHSLTKTDKKDATCTENGNIDYWHCSECGEYFSDGEGIDEITLDDTVTAAKGHSYNNGKCTDCGAYEDGIGAKLEGYSLSLDGNIGVNFYMELDESVLSDDDAYMEFTLPNKTTKQVPISEAKKATVGTEEYYVFSCEVAAKEMDDTIKAQMITANGNGTEYTYTVRDYAEYIIDKPDTYGEETVALVEAMLNYGDYAAAYFNEVPREATPEMKGLTAEALLVFEKSETRELPEGIKYYGSSLLLESETTLRHYFKVEEGTNVNEYGFTDNKENNYYVDFTNISAVNLSENKSFTVGDYTIVYSPLSYVYAVLKSASADESLKNLCKALVLYSDAANTYAASTSLE